MRYTTYLNYRDVARKLIIINENIVFPVPGIPGNSDLGPENTRVLPMFHICSYTRWYKEQFIFDIANERLWWICI